MNTPYIVAEISGNHLQDISRAIALIHAAADAGADAVKFQLYDPDKMAPAGLTIAHGPWKGRIARDLYREAMTPWHWFPELFDVARKRGMEAFSSVFCTEGLGVLESLGCPRYKIASFEITDLELIRAAAATGKPMIISTGMASLREIHKAVMAVLDYEPQNAPQVTVLKCTSAYPAVPGDANLATLADLRREAPFVAVGLSDHTLGNTVAIAAAALGAMMIEKHLTLLRSDGGPDAAFSLEPHEFADMVKACRDAAAAIGTVHYGPTESERPQLQLKGRTLAARHG